MRSTGYVQGRLILFRPEAVWRRPTEDGKKMFYSKFSDLDVNLIPKYPRD